MSTPLTVRLQQLRELLDCEARVPNDVPKRALGKFPVVRNRKPPVGWIPVPKDDVAAPLVIDLIPGSAQRLDRLPP